MCLLSRKVIDFVDQIKLNPTIFRKKSEFKEFDKKSFIKASNVSVKSMANFSQNCGSLSGVRKPFRI